MKIIRLKVQHSHLLISHLGEAEQKGISPIFSCLTINYFQTRPNPSDMINNSESPKRYIFFFFFIQQVLEYVILSNTQIVMYLSVQFLCRCNYRTFNYYTIVRAVNNLFVRRTFSMLLYFYNTQYVYCVCVCIYIYIYTLFYFLSNSKTLFCFTLKLFTSMFCLFSRFLNRKRLNVNPQLELHLYLSSSITIYFLGTERV